jgi:hypothetical protein
MVGLGAVRIDTTGRPVGDIVAGIEAGVRDGLQQRSDARGGRVQEAGAASRSVSP